MVQEKKDKFDPKWDKSKETYEEYMARVQAHIKKNKRTDWSEVDKFATKFVKDVRKDPDAGIAEEIDPGRKYTPKKRKKQIK